MPRKPKIATFTNSSVDVLNAICVEDLGFAFGGLKAYGLQLTVQNLINRIGRVYVTSKMYQNPLALFKRGYMEFGESIEEIFVGLAKPFQYDPAVAEETLFKREKPNVQSAFPVMNFQKYYKITIEEQCD